jgi:hypothetical protein
LGQALHIHVIGLKLKEETLSVATFSL